jgi:hypothetical protein
MNKFNLTDEWTDEADFYVYEETTADGYSIWIATSNPNNIDINEDVYYYDNDLDDVWDDILKKGGLIYTDDLDNYTLKDALEKIKQ